MATYIMTALTGIIPQIHQLIQLISIQQIILAVVPVGAALIPGMLLFLYAAFSFFF